MQDMLDNRVNYIVKEITKTADRKDLNTPDADMVADGEWLRSQL